MTVESPIPRKIIHVDADCFYAAIEMRDDPALRGKPMAVGGSADRRGVITTCNYEARAFGVHSAMASATALRKCPHLILVKPRFDAYREASAVMRDIFFDYTPLVEPLSLDEAFLDVSDTQQCQGSATLIAEEIRGRVRESLGITVSAGVAPNKFLAKIASDWEKPDGLFVLTPADVDAFVQDLPVNKIFGVGKVTAGKLNRQGIATCGDLRAFTALELSERFGSFGQRLHELSHGEDQRAVKPSRRRKSLSVEHTYPEDLPDFEACREKLPDLIEELERRLARVDEHYVPGKAFVKIKFSDFSQTTVERIDSTADSDSLEALLKTGLERKALPVRLLGVGVRFSDRSAEEQGQISLFEVSGP
jgi:DNA polymerase-4